ncbi:MAG: hypothetical protein JWR84_3154 [Caulobacter sp.]|nr:hypothetical protein [Caulobacter sp.]
MKAKPDLFETRKFNDIVDGDLVVLEYRNARVLGLRTSVRSRPFYVVLGAVEGVTDLPAPDMFDALAFPNDDVMRLVDAQIEPLSDGAGAIPYRQLMPQALVYSDGGPPLLTFRDTGGVPGPWDLIEVETGNKLDTLPLNPRVYPSWKITVPGDYDQRITLIEHRHRPKIGLPD